jgi:hypothetical protein
MRANSENDLVMFDAEDGTQLTLHADSLWWESDSLEGERDPPLRVGQVPVGASL